ncbi:MAG: multidrug ABC transporter ATP-binding protein [Chloroflexi bacterium RBG_19FT_COMBO_62_14]|nr:MAG: multidrug ABC transporter ATP-binding protein [Chloroflexi bacterium RBG_19FT_COMBO_62_14]
MIKTEKLTKRFGDKQAVDGLTLEVESGEVFGFLGPNGAGKTTTIRMLAGLIAPTAGTAWIGDLTLGQQDDAIRSRVGILTESPGLYDRLGVARNLEFFAALYDVEDIPAQVEKYLRMLGLWDRRHDPAGTLSKGMRQKLAIARALLHEPAVLFLDEPTSALDPEAARLVREFLSTLKHEGRTIFLCTHNLDEADRLCDRIAVFNTRLLALDTPTALRRNLYGRTVVFHLSQIEPRFARRLEDFDFVHGVQAMDNKLVVTLDSPETQNPPLIRALVEAGADVQFVGEIRRTLEDVYLQLVERSGSPEIA